MTENSVWKEVDRLSSNPNGTTLLSIRGENPEDVLRVSVFNSCRRYISSGYNRAYAFDALLRMTTQAVAEPQFTSDAGALDAIGEMITFLENNLPVLHSTGISFERYDRYAASIERLRRRYDNFALCYHVKQSELIYALHQVRHTEYHHLTNSEICTRLIKAFKNKDGGGFNEKSFLGAIGKPKPVKPPNNLHELIALIRNTLR